MPRIARIRHLWAAPLATARGGRRIAGWLTAIAVGTACLASAGAAAASAGATASIVGGAPAQITSLPYQVALWDPASHTPAAGQFCGGVILDATHVATAAHCLYDERYGLAQTPDRVAVLAGATSLDRPTAASRNIPASAVSFDPEYDPVSDDFDIGVVTLAAPLYTTPGGTEAIAPIPLATPGLSRRADRARALATVSGWGDMRAEAINGQANPRLPYDLRAVGVPLVGMDACRADYGGSDQITARMLCAGEPAGGKDACYGDSGGPLTVRSRLAPGGRAEPTLVGIAAEGAGCAQPHSPGIYTRVADPRIASFLTSTPPPAPSAIGAPTIAGGTSPGDALTCNPGQWSGAVAFTYQFAANLGGHGVPLNSPSASNSYTPRASDPSAQIYCEVKATGPGGYDYGESSQLGAATGPGPKLASQPPSLTLTTRSCARRTCHVRLRLAHAQKGTPAVRFTAVLEAVHGGAHDTSKNIRARESRRRLTLSARHLRPGTLYVLHVTADRGMGNPIHTRLLLRTKRTSAPR